MEIQLNYEALKEVIEALSAVSPVKSQTSLAYEFTKLEVFPNHIGFYAFNGEVSYDKRVPHEQDLTSVAFGINTKQFVEIIKNLEHFKPVKIKVLDDRNLQISQGRSRFTLSNFDPSNFLVPTYPNKDQFTPIAVESLTEIIETLLPFIPDHDHMTALTCLMLEATDEEGFMRGVGCDGKRLFTVKVPGVIEKPILLQKNQVGQIRKMLMKAKEASFFVSNEVLYLIADGAVITARTVNKAYPNYRGTFPKGHFASVIVNPEEFLASIKRVRLVAQTEKSERCMVEVLKEMLIITSKTLAGEAREELAVLSGSQIDSKMELKVNPLYLQQALEKLGGEEVHVRIYGPKSPFVMTAKNNKLALVMPMNL